MGLTLALLFALPLCARAEQHYSDASANVARVLQLADERMALMPGVAAYKWQHEAPVQDPARERAVTTRAIELAQTLGLASAGVREVFDLQVRVARESQARLHELWRTRGFDFAGPVPSLDQDLRPRLDRFTPDFLRALYLAAPELSRPDFVTAYGAGTDALHESGWTAEDKRALLDALAKVRLLPLSLAPPLVSRISATGVLRVGTTGDYAPFSLERDGTLTGADIDLADSLARRLSLTPVFIRTSWPTLLNDLQANRFDIALSGISITPARQQVAAFSVPYSTGGKAILARCAETGRYASLAAVDRRGVRVIVNPGGTNEQYVRDHIKHASVRVYPDNKTIFDEIRAKRADVMITDDVEIALQARRHADLCPTSRTTLTHADKAVLLPQNDELMRRINAVLNDAIRAGEPKRLLDQNLR